MTALGEAVVEVGADTSDLESQTEKGANRAAKSAADRLAKIGSGTSRAGKALTFGLTAPIIAAGAASINTQKQFEQSMNLLAVNADIDRAGKKMDKLSGLAKKLGADTVFSAGEAAEAMLELSKGGFKPAEISGGGVQATMALAATEGLALADSATIVGNALNTFALKAKDANQITDALAAGSAASSASVASLAEGLGNVGPIARQSGMSLQDTVAALAELDQAGIKGAEGGTALRSFLTRLVPQGKAAKKAMKELGLEFKNQDGSFKDFGDIAQQLQEKLAGLSDSDRAQRLQVLFGAYAKQAAAVFLEGGAKGYAKYTKEVNKAGTAQKLADARMSGTAGAIEKMSGSVETASLALGEALAPTVIKVAGHIEKLANWFTGLDEGTQQTITTIGGLVAAVGPLLFVTGKLFSATSQVMTGFSNLSAGMKNTETRSAHLGNAFRTLAGVGGMALLVDGANRSNKAIGVLETTLGGAAAGFAVGGPIGAGIGTGIALFLSLKEAIAGTNDVKMPTPKQLGLEDIITGLDQANGKATELSRGKLFDFLSGKTKGAPPAGLATGTTIKNTAALFGIPDKQLIDAMSGNVEALAAVKKRLNKVVKENPDSFGGVSGPVAAQDAAMLLSNIQQSRKAFAEQALEIRKGIAATGDYKALLAGIPKELITKIEAQGLPVTTSGVAALQKQLNLTPDQVQTVISATGVPTTVAKVQSVINKGNEWKRLHPTTTVDANTRSAEQKVAGLVSYINNLLAGNFTALVGATGAPKKKANGGRVFAGMPYIVGERRPELFVPGQNGRIVSRVPPPAKESAGIGYAHGGDRTVQLIVQNPVASTVPESLPRALSTLSFALGMS